MTQSILFACRAMAEQATVPKDFVTLRLEGYHIPGDGGGALYRRVAKRPGHAGHLRSADGGWWEIGGHSFDARQFGATGDGSSDDSEAVQAALDCPLVGALHFSPGSYRVAGLKLRRNCTLSGDGAELVTDDALEAGDLLSIRAPGAWVRQLTFRGVRYQDAESPVGPETLLRIDPPTPEDESEVRIQDLTFIGGRKGCVIGLVSNVFIDRVRFEHCRHYALVLTRGPRRIVVNGLIASGIGEYGALKTDLENTVRATERLVINDFVITDCGMLERDPILWQEGLDLVAGFAREIVVSNGVISHCGNGGIELKTGGGLVLDEDDAYQDILITNVVIALKTNAHGIALNWHGGRTNAVKRGCRIMLANNIIRHEGASSRAASGIHISAWSNLHIVSNFIDGASEGIVIAPEGASDNAAANLRLAGNQITGVQTGISVRTGSVADLALSQNVIDCRLTGISLSGAHCQGVTIDHNHIRQAGGEERAHGCIFMRNAQEVEIWGNRLRTEDGYGVHVEGDRRGASSGTILQNSVRSGREAFRVDGGRWELFENFVQAEPQTRTIMALDPGAVAAAWNIRGLRAGRPRDRASPGDIVLHVKRLASPSAAPIGWWTDLSSDDDRAAWREMPVPPTPAEMRGIFTRALAEDLATRARERARPLGRLARRLLRKVGLLAAKDKAKDKEKVRR